MTDTGARRNFYGRIHGKTLRASQKDYLAEDLGPLTLRGVTVAENPARSALDLGFVKGPLWLEVGFGGGEHLLDHARRRPDTGFFGVEPFVNGMSKLLSAVARDHIGNIRVYPDDAITLLDWLPPAALDGVDLFYPDPWPKKKHWKRRFVNPANLDRIARVLKPGGLFRFASDIDTYVNWTLLHCRALRAFAWQAQTADDWNAPYEDWPGTRYEAKALREGRRPAYLRFARI